SGEAPAEEQAPTPPPEPQPQPEQAETPAPVEPVVAETPPPVETPPPAETPPVVETPPVTESPSLPSPGPERTAESTAPEAPAKSKGDEKSAVAAVLPSPPGSAGAGPAGEAPPSNLSSAPTGSMVINLGEASVAEETATSVHAGVPGKPGKPGVAGGGGDGSGCALPGLGGPTAGSCATASWMRPPGALTPGAVTLAPVAPALDGAVATTRSSGDDPGGSAGGGRPMPPSPGPAPSGASGGAAAGGAGVGLSGFIAFAVLLLLAAPRAMRRLRLACQPWLTA